ncbi:histidine kinase dimerization/phospho-acceptor domain-containing protein [Streptomyces sp. R28]|uniref:histidine kinase n=1 Tax=Streptomyces sp. R28 TaxID=3238628 RepID=A0AB39Q3R8_9ACTN
MTADIAHEPRTPVAAMVTATGLLPPGPATDLVAGGVRKLRGLVEDVLEVARLDAHAVAVETGPRQVSAMARRSVAGLDGAQGRVDVRIVADTPRRPIRGVWSASSPTWSPTRCGTAPRR